jgi:hypothetical protein
VEIKADVWRGVFVRPFQLAQQRRRQLGDGVCDHDGQQRGPRMLFILSRPGGASGNVRDK